LRHREPSERHSPDTTRSRDALRIAAVCVLIVAYTGLSHYCNTHGAHRLGAALALAPLLFFVLGVLRHTVPAFVLLLATAAGALLLYDAWPILEKNFSVVYLLQECGMYGLLAVGFGRSLRAGEVALCTRLADKLHGPLNAAEIRYSRRVTLAWTLFFVLMAATVAVLYLSVPRAVWSAFVNFGAIPLIVAMFAVEYAVRSRVLPHSERRGIWATMRVFFASR
jgi:uncharacterized membrane protein